MINLATLVLSISAITVDPGAFCSARDSYSALNKQYGHCKKGDLIFVNTVGYRLVCDLSKGIDSSGRRSAPIACIYRGVARQVRLAPDIKKRREDYKKKKQEEKSSGRRKL